MSWSVIVPTHGRLEQLRRCLESLAQLDWPADGFEVLVVDDGGGLAAEAVRPTARLIRQEHAGPAAARNRGAHEAAHERLAFVDDDCTVAPGWLAGFTRTLDEHPGAAAGGRVVNGLPGNVFSTATETMIEYMYAASKERFVTSNNLAVPRARFLELGGFDERFPLAAAEDRDFCQRWLASGAEIVTADGAVVEHSHELSLRGFVRQHFAYGRGAYIYRSRDAPARKRATTRFYRDLVTEPLRSKSPRALQLSAALAVSQLATVAGYALEAAYGRTMTLRP
ncbi:MAG TPA: glycosyltransferase [Gaiellaceae bacterium]|jgi:GT2 family glycosyltransferase